MEYIFFIYNILQNWYKIINSVNISVYIYYEIKNSINKNIKLEIYCIKDFIQLLSNFSNFSIVFVYKSIKIIYIYILIIEYLINCLKNIYLLL